MPAWYCLAQVNLLWKIQTNRLNGNIQVSQVSKRTVTIHSRWLTAADPGIYFFKWQKKRCNLLTASKTQCCFGCSRILWSCAGTSRLQSKYCRTRTIKNVKWIVNRKACPRSPNSFTNCVSPPSRHAIFLPGCVGLYFEKPFRKSCHIVISLIAILVDFQTAAHTGAPWRLRGE